MIPFFNIDQKQYAQCRNEVSLALEHGRIGPGILNDAFKPPVPDVGANTGSPEPFDVRTDPDAPDI